MSVVRRVTAARTARVAAVAAATALATMAAVAPASAAGVELNGSWAPFNRCPVDSPTMLTADGVADTAICISSSSASGSIKLGSSQVPTGRTDLQAGVITHADGTSTVVSPPEGALVAAPATLPGGLLGLMCPNNTPVVGAICKQLADAKLNKVVATVESVNTPTDFQLLAGVMEGQPILSLPVRIKLDNPFLGDKCYIGSAKDPVVLRPQNATAPDVSVDAFDPDGTENPDGVLNRIVAVNANQGDSTYSVPGANGCGFLGALNFAVNLKSALPSASGKNNVVLNSASTHVAMFADPTTAAPNEGALLSQHWHAGVK
ncbi:hypothetical protein OKJ48_05785 [Streptomyces kunmingensis]|uniref:Secreted protein n=1 Tax=Streptomyces kunmingensis TaxID=68225 RepID=A0ABU6C6M6_9ACTN|nr:hypothetical protein [Streptomyces kunmingensis]MEB3959761.1 hypothetical protein [Streptomyces kunmingensis]